VKRISGGTRYAKMFNKSETFYTVLLHRGKNRPISAMMEQKSVKILIEKKSLLNGK